MVGSRLKYLTAFLNSKLCEWYFDKIAATSGVGTRRWIKVYVEQIKVPTDIDKAIELKLNSLVLNIQSERKAGNNTFELEQEIDSIIYSLFGLTEDEIKYVQGAKL